MKAAIFKFFYCVYTQPWNVYSQKISIKFFFDQIEKLVFFTLENSLKINIFLNFFQYIYTLYINVNTAFFLYCNFGLTLFSFIKLTWTKKQFLSLVCLSSLTFSHLNLLQKCSIKWNPNSAGIVPGMRTFRNLQAFVEIHILILFLTLKESHFIV